MQAMMTVDDIFKEFGGPSEFARAIGLRRESHATIMKMRGSIPVRYWSSVVAAASERGHEKITLEALASVHSVPPAPSLTQGDAA